MRCACRKLVTLEMRFGGNFPSEPPFVRVVSPRFAFHTGHVTVGGSICMAELTSHAWQPTFSIPLVLEMIHQQMLDGNGQLDPHRAHLPYSMEEAVRAFKRVASQHGWG